MEGPDSISISNPDEKLIEIDSVEVKSHDAAIPGKESASAFDKIMEGIESSPFLGQRFLDKLKRDRDIQILLHGLPQDATMEQIVTAYDKAYIGYLKSKADVFDEGIFERYEESTDENPLSFYDRQSVVKMLASPANKFYKTKEGLEVGLAEYFNDYYKSFGVSVQIRFTTLSQDQIRGVERMFRLNENKFHSAHLHDDAIAVPVIDIKRDDKIVSVPLIGGDLDITGPMIDPETRKDLGSFIGLKIVHDAEYAASIQSNLGFLVHEFDHAVRGVLSDQENWIDELEDRIIPEGTAEMASQRFGATQGRFEPRLGFDYQNSINISISTYTEGKDTGMDDIKNTYASGLVLAERMRISMGENKFWDTAYMGEQNLTEGEIKKLREKIVGELEKQKEAARQFLTS